MTEALEMGRGRAGRGHPHAGDFVARRGGRVRRADARGQSAAQRGDLRPVRRRAGRGGSRRCGRGARGESGEPLGLAARRARHDQGKRRPGRLRDRQRRGGVPGRHRGRRQSRRRELEEGGRDHHRPHQYAGVQLPPRHRQRFPRPHVQPVVAHAHAGRLERRRGLVGRRGHHAARARQRHRGLGALSRVLLRARRPAAVVRARARVQPDRQVRARHLRATDVGAGAARAIACATSALGFEAMAQRDPRDPWWVPVPLDGPPRRRRSASRSSTTRPISAAPRRRRPWRPRWRRRRRRWPTRATTIVDERTPGFTAAVRCSGSRCCIPEFRRFMQADFDRDGDDGIRIAMRFMLDNVPDRGVDAHLRALADRTRARARLVRVPRAHAAGAGAGVHGVALRAGFRPRKRGADDWRSGASRRR